MPTFLSLTDLVPSIPILADHITFTKPPGLQVNDVLILVAGTQTSVSVSVTTTGWTTIGNFLGDDGDNVLVAAYTMTGSEGSTMTVNFSQDMNSNELIACLLAYRNARIPTELVEGDVNVFGSIKVNCPSVIPSNVGDFYIGIVHDYDNADDVGEFPDGSTSRYNAAVNDGGLAVFDFAAEATYPTGVRTVTMSSGFGSLSAFAVLLRDSALSADEQAMIDHSKNSLPRWLTGGVTTVLEWLHGYKVVFDSTLQQGKNWIYLTYLDFASGSALDQHAIDRGTTRQNGESDAALRERLRNISDALTEPALITGVDSILDGTGLLAQLRVQAYATSGWNTVFQAKNTIANGGLQTAISLSMVSDSTNPPTLVENTITGATVIHYSAGVTTRTQVENLVISSSFFTVETNSSSGSTTLNAQDAFPAHNFYLSKIVGLRRDRGHLHENIYPTSISQLTGPLPGITDAWLCDEASGNLAPIIGSRTLTASGAINYGNAGARGGSDKAISFTNAHTGKFDAGANAFSLNATDGLIVAWVGRWTGAPTVLGTICGNAMTSFSNGWSLSGTDGTSLNFSFNIGPGSTWGVNIGNMFAINNWHVGIAVVDRVTNGGCVRMAIQNQSNYTQTLSTINNAIAANSVISSANFTIGNGPWISNNDNFLLSALYIGKGFGVGNGMANNMSSVLSGFSEAVSGHQRIFCSRGNRMTGPARPSSYIFILPFGTTAATGSSVGEYLRKNGPGGYNYMIERRLNP